MNQVEERWIRNEVARNHRHCPLSHALPCECCGKDSSHVDVEGVSLCCECVALLTLEEQQEALRVEAKAAAETYGIRREERLKNIATISGETAKPRHKKN